MIEDNQEQLVGEVQRRTDEKVYKLKDVFSGSQFLKLNTIDYDKMMDSETPLVSKKVEQNKKSKDAIKPEESKAEEEILKRFENLSKELVGCVSL